MCENTYYILLKQALKGSEKPRRIKLNWEEAVENYDKFFSDLSTLRPVSLEMSSSVLEARENLEKSAQNVHRAIKDGIAKLGQLIRDYSILKEHEAQIAANANFTYPDLEPYDEWVSDKHAFMPGLFGRGGQYVTKYRPVTRTNEDMKARYHAALGRKANAETMLNDVAAQFGAEQRGILQHLRDIRTYIERLEVMFEAIESYMGPMINNATMDLSPK